MDSLTHIAIGACIGDLFLGKKIGRRAMAYGAVAASLPDIDFISSFWLDTPDDLLAHRGFTHSILFAIIAVIAMAFFLRHRHRVQQIPVNVWLLFLGTEIFIHLFLDAFNIYGVGWFEPFSHVRISFKTIFVADPFFSIWPGIAALVLLFMHRDNQKRKRWAVFGLSLCSLYLLYCVGNKIKIDQEVQSALDQQGIHYSRYFTTPTPFNSWLWYAVVESDAGFYIGYRSVFDKTEALPFSFQKRNESLLQPYRNEHGLQQLVRFSQGYYTADTSTMGVEFNDLRFGQIMGWQDPDAKFVFHYYLQDASSNKLVVQRGRFANWNWEHMKQFVKRIFGKQD